MQCSPMRWERHPGNPILPSVAGSWRASQTANPDLLPFGDAYYLYFRGQSGGHDRIGLGVAARRDFDGVRWDVLADPLIDVGGPGSWDETHVLDPATVLVDGTVYLYYSAVSPRCPRCVCLATSRDGRHFEKFAGNPVMIGGAPEIVHDGQRFHLFFWRGRAGGGFQIHRAVSEDGRRFCEPAEEPCLPAGQDGSWDSHSVETPRIFREGALYYLIYCGSDRWDDYPSHAGLAVSRDLAHWRKFPGNPIFSRGAPGAWDEGAIWFTTVERIGGRFWMWYEGYGGGTARDEAYGSYLVEGRSQIGLATLDAPYLHVPPTADPLELDRWAATGPGSGHDRPAEPGADGQPNEGAP